MKSFYEAMRPFIPFVLQFVFSSIWVFTSRMNILETHPRLLYYTLGTIFSNISSRLIISQMCGSRCEVFNVTLVPLIIASTFVAFVPQSIGLEHSLLQLVAAVVTLFHMFYGVCVVSETVLIASWQIRTSAKWTGMSIQCNFIQESINPKKNSQ
jgi:ethanolaminephosphotransferase